MSPLPEAGDVRSTHNEDEQHQQHEQQQQQQKQKQASVVPSPSSPQPRSQPAALSAEEARRARRRVSAEARKRIANACLQCKARKQKCSGERPQCNICKRRGAECIYVEQTPRPTKRQRRDTPSAVSNTGSSVAPTSPEGRTLWGNSLDGENDAPSATTSAGLRSPSGVGSCRRRGGSVLSTSTGYDGDVPGSGNHGGRDGYHDAGELREEEGVTTSEEDDSKVEAPVDHKTRMLSDPHGRLLYIGETGSLSFLARIRKVVKETLGPSAFTLDSGQHSFADRPLIPGPERLGDDAGGAASIPQNIPELLDLFFEHCNDIYYVLDREEADAVAASAAAGPNATPATGSRTRDVAILNAMCALGCFYTQQPLATSESGMRYFSTARALMEDVFECADFWSVRLLLLLALYLHFAAKRNSSFVYIGLAIRIAESLGLHQITRCDPLRYDEDTRRRRRMVFWTLYSLDRFSSYSFGRPLAINDETCADPVLKLDSPPSEDRLLSLPCHPSQPPHIHLIHRSAARVRLSVIIGHIVHRVYLRRSINRDIAEELSAELKAWWDSMPQCTSLHDGIKNPVVELHLAYLHAVALLTRPFLQKVVEEYTVDYGKNRHSKKCSCAARKGNVKRKILRYAGACVLVAERTVSLAHRMLKRNNLPRNDCGFVYHLFTAGLILFFSSLPQLLHPNDSPHPDSTSAAKSQPLLVSLLADCAVTDPITAKRYHRIMSHFLDAINDYRTHRSTRSPTPQPQQTTHQPQPDLLDELQATSSGYFSGALPMTRDPSTAGVSREESPSAVAAHALVQLPSGNPNNNYPNNLNLQSSANHISTPLPPASDLSQTPVGPFFMQHLHQQQHQPSNTTAASSSSQPGSTTTAATTFSPDADSTYFPLSDFSSFFGWQQTLISPPTHPSQLHHPAHQHPQNPHHHPHSAANGFATTWGSSTEEESPNATGGMWELSWDAETVSDFLGSTVGGAEEGKREEGVVLEVEMGLGMGMG
ncbi:hypothetical protein EX30DRAFT_397097 [Ascodesmis nigricans]|uniref:Zn(2)-C6 fungal-type domain-containing protein n=1 Tax=Ascodesmis nigricans TaxID=341454 RepID=A0A4V3SID3_9PEZI|nr:hypothetical protein EX30DRAFT_397097 [Ascodesmis nigricans]